MRSITLFAALLFLAAPAAAQDMPLSQILIDGENWKPFATGFKTITGLTADRTGHLFVADAEGRHIVRLDNEGKASNFADIISGGLAFGPDSALYCADWQKHRVLRLDAGAKIVWEKAGHEAHSLTVARNGNVYCTVPEEHAVYLIAPDGSERKVAEGIGRPTGLVMWPDQGTLVVADAAGKHLYAYRVEKDGSLTCKEGYYTLRLPPLQKASGVGGLTVDMAGRLYAATPVGVQIFDPTGRLSGVLLKPVRLTVPTAVAFGGADGSTLFIACGDTVFARKTQAKGR
jgi:enterochelin esterase family protein